MSVVKKRLMPRCMGLHRTADQLCDGSPAGKTEEERAACIFRDRCVALQKHCEAARLVPEQFVKVAKHTFEDGERRWSATAIGDDDVLTEMLAKWALRWGVVNGRVTKTKPEDAQVPQDRAKPKRKYKRVAFQPPIGKEARARAKVRFAESTAKARAACTSLVEFFVASVQSESGLKLSSKRAGATPGELFSIDRLEKSRYLTLYVRTERAGRAPVVSVYLKPAFGMCEVRFPVGCHDLEEFAEVKRLKIRPIKDGAFKAVTGKLDRELLSVAACAVAFLVKRGKVVLPAK